MLSVNDRGALVTRCAVWDVFLSAYEEWVQLGKPKCERVPGGTHRQHPLISTFKAAAKEYIAISAEFGGTPSARARLALAANQARSSKFDGLIGGRSGKAK